MTGRKWMGRACLAASALALSTVAQASGVWVDNAWIRLLPGDLPTAGYFTLHNDTSHTVALTAVQSPDYGMAMMHRSDMKTGRMLPVQSVQVPPHGRVQFQPDGYHIMFMQPKAHLSPGRHVPVALLLAGGQHVNADFITKGATGQ